MLPIFICDDDQRHLHKLNDIIEKCISERNLNCEIILATQKGGELISHIEDNPFQRGVYFLDIELNRMTFDGIELGKAIRNMNSNNKIVYVTSHENKAYLTFKNYLNCTDFIVKDDWGSIKERISICLNQICKDEDAEVYRQFIYKGSLVTPDKLFFIESAREQHQIVFHYEESILTIWGSLKDVGKHLDDNFFQCSRSLIVNLSKISYIQEKNSKIVFHNGKNCVTYTSGIRNLKKKGINFIK